VIALSRGGNLALRLGEEDLTVPHVHLDDVPRLPVACEKLLGERVFDERLNRSAQRTRAIDRVGPILGHELTRGVGEVDGHAVGDETITEVRGP